jgi:hypothetical protein
LQTRNAHLVMRNEKLNRQLSFMPPEMWHVVAETTRRQSPRYEQQWVDPHYLHPSAGEYTFIRHEPNSGIVVERMQRCASIVSLNDLYHETDEVLEYLKSHNGIVDQPINDNDGIIEEAVRTAPAVETAPDTRDLRGGIPSANEIATPTVEATLATRFRMIQTIQQNEGAPKRTHSTTVPPGHTVHPTKVPKPNPQASLSTSSHAAPTNTPGYRASSYEDETPMDDSYPFSPLPR